MVLGQDNLKHTMMSETHCMLFNELSVIVGDIHPGLLNQYQLPIISNLSYICVNCNKAAGAITC